MTFKCPMCGIGKMVTETIAIHNTRLGDIPIQIKNARIAKCNHCNETSVSAKEVGRWEKIQQEDKKS